jgi:uncharacterized RDD family membrane protein YckC
MTRASIFVRFFAILIDCIFLFLVHSLILAAAALGLLLGPESASYVSASSAVRSYSSIPFLASLFVFFYYFTVLTADGEGTIGKRVCGIKVVTGDGHDFGRIRAFVRCFCYMISAVPFFLGFLIAVLFKGRSLHDMLAGTMVVKGNDGLK